MCVRVAQTASYDPVDVLFISVFSEGAYIGLLVFFVFMCHSRRRELVLPDLV